MVKLTEKETKLLKFMQGYSVGSTKDVADDMKWSSRGAGIVLANLSKKGLVKSRQMTFFPAKTWSLTEKGSNSK